ncbi:MAG: translocase [Acidimicrobiia bacterium]|nr:translocase [Acidimicrobiia bacterium]
MSTISIGEPERKPDLLDRFLSLFSEVRPSEGLTAILLAANVFLLLATYYALKTIRDALILDVKGGAEVKSYSAAGLALLFLIIVPMYSAFASRVDRVKLVGGVTLFFISNLFVFYLLGMTGMRIGIPYFFWVGIFNMLIVAQFWGFANDIYSEEQGKRLFPIVGVGASLGAWIGSLTTKQVYREMGPYNLMLASAAGLAICIVLTLIVHRRQTPEARSLDKKPQEPMEKSGAFQLLFQNRYLLLIAFLVFLLNCVNTTGGYILDKFIELEAQKLPQAERGPFIGEFVGGFFGYVNLLGFLIQTFLVSRLFKWIGVRGALFILPFIALGGYGILAFFPVLTIVLVAKVLENSTDYSLNNTVRHALYLPTSRDAKYKAKAATDTFFVRAGDMTQAAIVFGGVQLGFGVSQFAAVNLVMVGIWLAIAAAIYRHHKRIATQA